MPYEIFNTCMLVPNVSVSNCSGWVQAWGSIGAIVFAWVWGNRQAKAAMKQAVELQKHERSEWVRGCIAIALKAESLVIELADTREDEYQKTHYNAHAFDLSLQALKSIPVHELGDYLLVEAFFEVHEALTAASNAAAFRQQQGVLPNSWERMRARATDRDIQTAKEVVSLACKVMLDVRPKSSVG